MAKAIGSESAISLDVFKKVSRDLVSTSESSYKSDNQFSRTSDMNTYDKEMAESIIASSDSEDLRDLSLFYFYSSGFYRKLTLYYANLLEYDTIIIPHFLKTSKRATKTDKSKLRYDAAMRFWSINSFEQICKDVAFKVFVEGAYYGMVKEEGDFFTLQNLPFKYCRSKFKTIQNIDIVELNLEYFDKITDDDKRAQALLSFPKIVQRQYKQYQNGKISKWIELEPGVGVYFNLYEERPMLISVIPAILDFKDYREIEKDKDAQAIKKILVQQVPVTNAGELVFEPEEAEELHKGVVAMLRSNKDVSVMTSYGKVDMENLQASREAVSDNLQKIERTIYSEAGVSKQIFSADGNLSLEKSIQNDISLVMILAQKLSNWISFILNDRFSDSSVIFTSSILPISYYNRDEYLKQSLNIAQFGYSYLVPAVASGIKQCDLNDLKTLENDVLHLDTRLKPLQSSYTQSGKTNSDGGTTASGDKQNEKDNSEKSDKTIQNIEGAK